MVSQLKKIPECLTEDENRFWDKADITQDSTECWNWKANRNPQGYGVFKLQGKNYQAHRVAFTITNGIIPEDKPFVCHSCDNPSCVNPSHLFVGTIGDNMIDKVSKNRQSSGAFHSEIMFRVAARGDANAMRKYPELVRRGDDNPSRLYPERVARGERHGSKTKPHKVVRGERVNTAVLNENLVVEIRELYQKGGTTLTTLGNRFGVGASAISRIVLRKTWKHVA